MSPEELKSVKHHMIDFLNPLHQYRITDFCNETLPIIENLVKKDTIPFICGGTNYYIQSLLWDSLVESNSKEESLLEKDKFSPVLVHDDDDSISTEQLYNRLKEVDPDRADNLHKNNCRKIYRSLQVYYQTSGKTHSQCLQEQREMGGSSIKEDH